MASYPRRAAEPADRDALFALRAAALKPVMDWDDAKERAAFNAAFDASVSASDMRSRWVIVEEGDGSSAIVATIRIDRSNRREIVVEDLVVVASFAGKGIATFLLRELIDEGMRADAAVVVHVPPRATRAVRLLRFLGFTVAPSKITGRSRFVFRA